MRTDLGRGSNKFWPMSQILHKINLSKNGLTKAISKTAMAPMPAKWSRTWHRPTCDKTSASQDRIRSHHCQPAGTCASNSSGVIRWQGFGRGVSVTGMLEVVAAILWWDLVNLDWWWAWGEWFWITNMERIYNLLRKKCKEKSPVQMKKLHQIDCIQLNRKLSWPVKGHVILQFSSSFTFENCGNVWVFMPTDKKDFFRSVFGFMDFFGTSRIFKKTIFPEQLFHDGR